MAKGPTVRQKTTQTDELKELEDRVHLLELKAREIEAKVRFEKGREELQALIDKWRAADQKKKL